LTLNCSMSFERCKAKLLQRHSVVIKLLGLLLMTVWCIFIKAFQQIVETTDHWTARIDISSWHHWIPRLCWCLVVGLISSVLCTQRSSHINIVESGIRPTSSWKFLGNEHDFEKVSGGQRNCRWARLVVGRQRYTLLWRTVVANVPYADLLYDSGRRQMLDWYLRRSGCAVNWTWRQLRPCIAVTVCSWFREQKFTI